MADLVTKVRKAIDDTLELAKVNAQNLKEIAQDYGKTARLKFELHQLKINKRKKYELLGKTVFPYLVAQDYKGLEKHETLSVLLDEIKNIINQIQLTQNELEQHLKDKEQGEEPKEKIKEEIKQIETEIETRLEEIKKIQEETKKSTKK